MRMNIETGLAVTDAMVHVTNVLSIRLRSFYAGGEYFNEHGKSTNESCRDSCALVRFSFRAWHMNCLPVNLGLDERGQFNLLGELGGLIGM